MQITHRLQYPAVLFPKGLWHELYWEMGFNESWGGGELVHQVFSYNEEV